VSGFAFSNSEYAYNELEDGAEIIGCSGECSVLPDEIDGRKVIGISDTAFSSGSTEHGTVIPWWTSAYNLPMPNQPPNPNQLPMPNQLTIPIIGTLKIPQGYQYIGDNFFSYNAIRDIVIPDSVLDISNDAFSMNPLSYVIFLGNRPNIGDRAFFSRYVQCIYDGNGNAAGAFPDRHLFSAMGGGEYEFSQHELFVLGSVELASHCPPISEISNSSILDDIYHPLEDMYRHKIYYCSGNLGWPGEPINGVIPEERNCDSVIWDIDQNNSVDALTDGLLLMRYAFGLRGDSLTENVISSDSLIDKAAVEQNIEQIMHFVDINDDGNFDALTDALILLRYLFGVSGNGLVDEEMLTSNRPSAGSIKAYIESHMIKALSN
jgi:hypothetical protein